MSKATPRHGALQYVSALIFALLAATGGLSAQNVRPGVEVLLAGDMASLKGMRVGLITNHTGVLRDGRSEIDALFADKRIKLVALFGPEHGLRGTAEAGADVSNDRDAKTGLPIYSLYGETNRPTKAMLENLDALVFDIQDIGTRYYTYPWTMALAMKAAAENGKRFVVLDRPNPIGGEEVQGNVNDTLTFVGLYPVPMRHGMTVGELATMINKRFNINADLVVIKAEGWKRKQYADQTGLPWIKPSPNMPSLESAIHYPGICLFEAVNVSVGRGTPTAFQILGAPWLDNVKLIEKLNGYHFQGVRFEPTEFTPVNPGDQRYGGEHLKGIRFVVTDREKYDPTVVAIAALVELRALHPDQVKISRGFDRLVGNSRVRAQVERGASVKDITKDWEDQAEAFEKLRKPYLLY